MKRILILFVALLPLVAMQLPRTASSEGIRIGSQRWAVKNLNTTTFLNGDEIPHAASLADWEKAGKEGKPAWCHYGNDPANDALYGKLYNYYAVADPRGLAPKGWVLPTDNDFKTLIDFLGGDLEAGTRMKTKTGWTENLHADNICGFTATPAGQRNAEGKCTQMGAYLYMWVANAASGNQAKAYTLYYGNGAIATNQMDKEFGLSVRCLVDLAE